MSEFNELVFKEQLGFLRKEANELFELLNSIDPIPGFEYMTFSGLDWNTNVIFQGTQPWCDGNTYRFSLPMKDILDQKDIFAKFAKEAFGRALEEGKQRAASMARLEAKERQEYLRLQEKYGL